MTRRLLVLLLLGGLVTFLSFLAVRRDADPSAITKSAEVERSAPDPADERIAPEPDPPVISDVESASPASEPQRATEELASGELRLHGTLVVVDRLGHEHTGESGDFFLQLWAGTSARGITVEVNEGAWSAEAAPRRGTGPFDSLSVASFELGGREASGPEERLPIPPDGGVELRVTWPPLATLRVRTADTGRDLESALVVVREAASDAGLMHPGGLVGSQGSSRSLPWTMSAPARESRFLYVSSPGHAWARVEVRAEEAEHLVILEPGGDLRVRIEDAAQRDPGTWLRVFSQDSRGQPLAEIALGFRSEALVQRLPTGVLDVAAQLGDRWSPRSLAREQIEIRAGETSELTLALQPVEPASWVVAEGSLTLPPAWELEDFELVLGLQEPPLGGWNGQVEVKRSQLDLHDAIHGRYGWSARVQPGHYVVLVPRTGYFAELQVGPEGMHDVEIEVPPPCLVRVRCIDAESEADVVASHLDWGFQRDGGTMIPSAEPFRYDSATGLWERRVPEGTVVVRAFREDDSAQTIVPVTSGVNDVVLPFARKSVLRVRMLDGTSEVDWRPHGTPELRPARGQEPPSVRRRAGEVLLEAREPGPYTLTVPDIPGYEPVPEALVHLEEGVVTELVVQLRRRP